LGGKSKMRRNVLAKFPKSFLLLAVGFLLFFSPFSGKAQTVSEKCEYVWKWVWVWENEPVTRYNGATGRYDTYTELQYVYRYRYVYDCMPVVVENNPTTSRGRNSSHPNTVRNAEGKLTPANGYQWVNNDDPNDLRVEPKPGLIESEPGKLRPASGYQWVNDDDPKDFRVEPKPGLVESKPGTLRPAKGYRWVNNDDPKDFRVERIP
jgi:hypothetical protein